MKRTTTNNIIVKTVNKGGKGTITEKTPMPEQSRTILFRIQFHLLPILACLIRRTVEVRHFDPI